MFTFFRRKSKQKEPEWVIPGLLTLHQSYEGLFIFGGIGSGKTTGPGQAAATGLLHHGNGLVLTAKPDETARWLRYCPDAVVFGPGRGCFDFMTYELSQPGGSIESVAQLLDMLVRVGARNTGKGDEPFWALYASKIFRRALAAVYYGTGKCGVEDLYLFITSAPESPAQIASEEWRARSCCWRVLNSTRGSGKHDFALARLFWLGEYPTTSEKTRSIGIAMATNILDKLLSGPVAEAVNGETTVSPDDVLTSKVVILDYPILTWRESGQLLQIIWKTCVQRAALRRADPDKPTFIWADEAQFFAVPDHDGMVQTVARQAKLINVCLTQNIPMLISAMGGKQAESEVDGWTANFQAKIFCQNSCPITNAYASNLIGQRIDYTFSGGGGGHFDVVKDWMGERQTHLSFSEHWMPQVRPEEFTRLTKGGKGMVETICYLGGNRLPNGQTWTRWWFAQ